MLFRHLLYRHGIQVKSAKHRNFTTDFFLFQHNKGTSRNTNLSKLSTKNKTCLSICMWPTLKCMNDLKIVLTFLRICKVEMTCYAPHFKVRLLTAKFSSSLQIYVEHWNHIMFVKNRHYFFLFRITSKVGIIWMNSLNSCEINMI